MVLHWLAAAQLQAGRVELAFATQQQAVELRPGDADLVEQLRQVEKKRKEGKDPGQAP
jgi:Flp pilus assembly protein TadD